MRKKICIALICSMFFVSSTLDAFAATNTPALDNADILDAPFVKLDVSKSAQIFISYYGRLSAFPIVSRKNLSIIDKHPR